MLWLVEIILIVSDSEGRAGIKLFTWLFNDRNHRTKKHEPKIGGWGGQTSALMLTKNQKPTTKPTTL
jgi:hypothetical protein